MSALFEATPAVSFVGRVVQREVGIVVGAARAHAPSIPVPPDCLISDRPAGALALLFTAPLRLATLSPRSMIYVSVLLGDLSLLLHFLT